jgi:hypothetical protein
MMKGSAWHDLFYENVKLDENYPHIMKLLRAVRARPEFKGILANPKPWHELVSRIVAAPEGTRVALYLPISNDE